jgi:DNA polymerase-3 subunit epsilon
MDFVAIDFEKLNDSQLSVCEVGLVVFKDGKEVGIPFHSYIKPVGSLERNDWAKKHLRHITDEMLLDASSYNELFPKLKQIIQDKMIVVHLKGADLNYIYRLEEHYNLPKLYSKWADTNEIAHNLGKKENLLGLYADIFGATLTEHHKAEDDARACGQIFERLSSEEDILRFIHEEEYLPSDIIRNYNATNTRHTQYGTATVTPDGLVFNHDMISDSSYFRGKAVALSGMSVDDKRRIKTILEERLDARCTSEPSGKTNVFIIKQDKVGPSKREKAIKLQKDIGLLVITDDYFWKLVKCM